MILCRDDRRLVVDKPRGLSVAGAVSWLALHHDIDARSVAALDAGTSGALPLAVGATTGDPPAVVTHVLLTDAAAAASLPAEFRRDDPVDDRPARTLFQRLDERTVAGRRVVAWRAVAAAPHAGQVRRHAARAGIPLLGDDAAGGPAWPRLALHAVEARWPDLAPTAPAPEPESFAAPDAGTLALAAALERRAGWPASVGDAWRCVHRDEIPGLPAAVDVYGGWLSATWYDEEVAADEAAGALTPLLDGLAGRLGSRGAVLRIHRRDPHRRGLVAETRVVGEPPPDAFTVTEHGLRYEVNLTRTQHAGLFLDQRDSRRRVARLAAGRRVANLFAFTCSFSVAAAAAGCEVVFSVDTARACLATGATNFALNDLTAAGRGKFVREDARRWLARQERRRDERPGEFRPFDLVICDPPVFAASRAGDAFGVEEEWPRLAASVAGLLGPGGRALFANNHRGGDHDRYRAQLEACFATVVDIPAPLDFPDLPGSPAHVRIFLCER